MTQQRRLFLKRLGALGLTVLPATRAFAAYPDKPIKLIVPFAPGGNADITGRLIAEGLTQALGTSVIVDNRGGAGGGIGAAEVAHAAPDGYTLLVGSNGPLTVNPFVQAKMSYDPLKDLLPIGMASITPHALIVNASVPARTVAEIAALSKKQQVSVGISGVGSATHMTLARFNAATGANLVYVPYKSGGALLPDLVAGQIQGAMTEFSSALPHHKSGKARFIAVASAARSPLAPEVPTMIESGVKDFIAGSFIGILAPHGTPADVIAKLQSGLAATLGMPKILERMKELGQDVASAETRTAQGFAAFIRQDYENSRKAAQIADLKKE